MSFISQRSTSISYHWIDFKYSWQYSAVVSNTDDQLEVIFIRWSVVWSNQFSLDAIVFLWRRRYERFTWRRIRRWQQYFPIMKSSSRISTIFLDRVSTVPMGSWILHAWIRRSKTFAKSFKSDDPCNRLMYTLKYHLLKGYVLTDFLHEEHTQYILY